MKNKILKILSYVLVALLASAATLFVAIGSMPNRYSKLDELENKILDCFIGDVDQKAIEDAAANAMVNALGDRWSYYIPADQYAAYKEQMNNAYVGVGVTIQQREDGIGLDVIGVTENGPAQEAGILVGDVIVAVSGQKIQGMALEEVRGMIQGEANTTVQITVLRDEKETTLTVTRRKIETVVATGTMLGEDIGLVTIVNFDARCADETIAAIESLMEQGAKKLIFDVRNNPGGYKHELVALLDYLLPEGVLFRSELYNGKVEQDKSDAKYLDIPMVVLVNGNSYSAAEFFAAALREYDAGIVVGEQTVGKGYFQSTFQLKDGSAVGLSIGKYYTPKGVSLAGVGITPDISIELDDETDTKLYYGQLEPMEDPHILAAMEALQE